MKVMCIDNFLDGHHCSYLKGISSIKEIEFVYVVPGKIEFLPSNVSQYVVPYDLSLRSLSYDLEWSKLVYRIAMAINPDIIHFMYGDFGYRYFGYGLGKFRNFRIVTTFHVIPDDLKHRVSLRFIASKIDRCVVHTEKLTEQLKEWGIANVQHIEYPCFFPQVTMNQKTVRRELGIPEDRIVFAALGGTRRYKGLDFLLEALDKIASPFHLLIAGSEEYFTREYINSSIRSYKSNVTLVLRQLTDDEFIKSIVASDWVVLPYRKDFTGASGPLAEGVMYMRKIIGPSSGSIGELIKKYRLGFTFESENVNSLRDTLCRALEDKIDYAKQYEQYRLQLEPTTFTQHYLELYKEVMHI